MYGFIVLDLVSSRLS